MEHNGPVNTTTSAVSGTGNWYTATPGGGTGRGPSGFALPGPASISNQNRQARRAQAKTRNEQFFGGLKHPKTPSQVELGRRIQAKLKGLGGDEMSHAATESMTEMIQNSLAGIYNSLNNYWPAFPGASAAETCDAQDTNCVDPWPTIDELREFADKQGYAMRVSGKAKARKDRSLKGVAVIISDHNHYDPGIQRELARFVDWPKPGNKFKVLVEIPADNAEFANRYCTSRFNRLDCIPIDDVANLQRSREEELIKPALLRILEILAGEGVPAAQKLLADNVVEDVGAVFELVHGLSESGALNKHQDEVQIFYAAFKRYGEFVIFKDKQRDKAMLAGLDQHLDPDTGLMAILGFSHVKYLVDELLKRMTVILTRRKDLDKDQLEQFDPSAKAKAH